MRFNLLTLPFHLFVFCGLCVITQCTTETKPNIIFVVLDDLGYGDIGYLNPEMEKATPNMNQLASEGIILNNFYASPECTPSRAQLLTGRYNIKTGLHDSVIHGTEPRGLSLDEKMLPEFLKEEGYKTAAIGKWHLGFHQPQYLPTHRGFDEFYGILTGGGGHYTHTTTEIFVPRLQTSTTFSLSGYNLWEDGAPITTQPSEELHTTRLYSDKALEFLNEQISGTEQPFFLYLAYQAVHGPIQADSEYYDGTLDTGCDKITVGNDPDIDYGKRKVLCGMIAMMDEGIGKLTSQLKETGQWDNTVVFILSDNGGVKRHGSSNGNLRGEKGEYFDGGVKVPAFISGGYSKNTATKYNGLFHITDFFSIALGLANISPVDLEIDGINQWDVLNSQEDSDKELITRTDVLYNMNSDEWGGGGALRIGDYKLLVENSVGDAIIFEAGQQFLAESDLTFEELGEKLGMRRQELFQTAQYSIFNIEKNPLEQDTGDCDDFEACTNLYNNENFAEIQNQLLEKWDKYSIERVASTELWFDDGPLASPEYLGGTWIPWRDQNGIPLLTFQLKESKSSS